MLQAVARIIATTTRPRAQVGEFANLKVVARNQVGLFLDWGLPKDVLLPFAELKKPLEEGQYCVAYLYLDKHTSRVLATTRLDRYLDKTPARYKVGDAVNLLLDPGLAFGTGTHPTTSLCLQWLDAQQLQGKTLIDFGCGSGILAIGGLLLGVEQPVGADMHSPALKASRDNAFVIASSRATCSGCPGGVTWSRQSSWL